MHKFPIFNYKSSSDLPYDELDELKFAVYIYDLNWECIFVNKFASQVHHGGNQPLMKERLGAALSDKRANDQEFRAFINKVQAGSVANITTISSITKKRISVTGYPLEDSYYLAVTILPNKESLMDELRNELSKKKHF